MIEKPYDELWTTRDGRKIPVADMDVDHLRNALRMMIRTARRAKRRTLTLTTMVCERREEDERRMLAMDKEYFDTETHERLADT
jgi:hypothetical protein